MVINIKIIKILQLSTRNTYKLFILLKSICIRRTEQYTATIVTRIRLVLYTYVTKWQFNKGG